MGSQQTVQLRKGLSSKLSPCSLDLYAGIYRNKNSNDQHKLLVDQSQKIKAKDQDKGKYDQSGLNKLLQDQKKG
jgi:hypothetical protein